jgi:5-methylcytosine-specific restriction endonuclease McrA
MPSSPNYVRDIKQEEKTAKARGEIPKNNLRKKARRLMVKKGLVKPNDGKDVDHIKALSKGGNALDPSNLRVVSEHDNRSYPRNKSGSMKSNT